MDPVARARFSEAWTSGRAALAQRMIFRILTHPESNDDAFLRMLGRAGDEQQEPHIGGLPIGVGCRAGLPRDLARFLEPKCERPLLPFFRLQLPERIAQR